MATSPRLHPESWQQLRQLVKLHGASAIIAAVGTIEEQLVSATNSSTVTPVVSDTRDRKERDEIRRMVTAKRDVPAVLVRNGKPIRQGETFEVARSFFRNGEGWYQFTNGIEVPDVFFS